MAEKSKILVIGGTGYIGKFIVEASAKAGHPTFVLVRETTVTHPQKTELIHSFNRSGVTLVYGDLNDHESLVKAIKQVDVVISTETVSRAQIDDQVNLIAAIKEAGGGHIKRFLPSEFGLDVERHNAVEPLTSYMIQESCLAVCHSIFVNGGYVVQIMRLIILSVLRVLNFIRIEVKYITVDNYLDAFLACEV